MAAVGGTQAKATYQDVLDAPEHQVAEIIDGELSLMPRPRSPHAWAASVLGGNLMNPFSFGKGGPGGWWIVDEPELWFRGREDVLVPDLAGWRRERMPDFPDTSGFTLPPDWVCEVLSKSTRKIDLGPKRAIYAREGIPWLWFVDPMARTLEALELRGGVWQRIALLKDDAPMSPPPFDAVSFPLDALWTQKVSEPPPPAYQSAQSPAASPATASAAAGR